MEKSQGRNSFIDGQRYPSKDRDMLPKTPNLNRLLITF